MKTGNVTYSSVLAALWLASAPFVPGAGEDQENQNAFGGTTVTVDQGTVQRMIAQWPGRPKLAAEMLVSKYGPPQEATPERLVWHRPAPYKRITVTKAVDAHNFPKPHSDFLEHTVDYTVPPNKADELALFDGSITFDRTRGEMSARCDSEPHNILSLNLANDIVRGKRDAPSARQAFSQMVSEDALGKRPPYLTRLQFEPLTGHTAFQDRPTLAGAPVRTTAQSPLNNGKSTSSDGEILGYLVAMDENELLAASLVEEKPVDPGVAGYARMLRQAHGKNLHETLSLGQKLTLTPVETPAIEALQDKAARELAGLVPLQVERFSSALMALMVKNHRQSLHLIETQLLPRAANNELKRHLAQTRQEMMAHLEAARQLQAPGAQGASGAESEVQTERGQRFPPPAPPEQEP